MTEKLELVYHKPEPPVGFWEVVGHEPQQYYELVYTTSTFAVKSSAEKFAQEFGGMVKHRPADFVLD